jgi:ribonuclease HI
LAYYKVWKHFEKGDIMYEAYFGGACGPVNPGGTATYGTVIFQDGNRVWECSEVFCPEPGHERETSNNVAEYSGLLAVLHWFADQDLFDVEIIVYGDSRMAIEQIFGSWKIRKGAYVPLALEARRLLRQFRNINGQWIPRHKNHIADKLSKAALTRAGVSLEIQPV